MIVYVILDKRGYEATDVEIIGVYSSKEKAIEARKQVLNEWCDGTFTFNEFDFWIDEVELDVTEFKI